MRTSLPRAGIPATALCAALLTAAGPGPAAAQQLPSPPGQPITDSDSVEVGRVASACLDLRWPDPPTGLSDNLLAARCQVVDSGELPATGETSWSWVLYRRESVYGADPDTPPGRLELLPDTIPEDELVLLAGRGGSARLRPAWHDRTGATFELISRPRAASLDPASALLAHRRCVRGTGGCMDYPYRLSEDGAVTALEPAYLQRIRDELPEEWGTWKGVWLDLEQGLAAEAAIYLPGDANCCPSLWTRATLSVAGHDVVSDSVAVFPEPQSDTWQVLPGERFGPIDGRTSEEGLRARVGAESVEPSETYLAEGFCTPGTRVFPDRPYEVEVAWADSARTRVAFVRTRRAEGPWHTPAGVRVGTTLAELEAWRGEPISFSGFGWDYGGGAGWEEHRGTLGLRLAISPDSYPVLQELAATDPRVDEIQGDRTVRSDHPVIRQITVVVEEIGLTWSRVAVERDCEELP